MRTSMTDQRVTLCLLISLALVCLAPLGHLCANNTATPDPPPIPEATIAPPPQNLPTTEANPHTGDDLAEIDPGDPGDHTPEKNDQGAKTPGDSDQGAYPGVYPGTGVAMASGANVAVIPLHGFIYNFHLESLQRRVDDAIQRGVSIVVFEINTPGGTVQSGLKISKFIKSIQLPTIAWINPEAYSAGILVASACDQIVMAPAAATGDCAPIVPGVNLAPTERAKMLSPILEEFRDSAHVNDTAYALFHAMCVLGVEVYQIEHPKTGQRMLVNQADYAVMVKDQSLDGGVLDRVLGLGGQSQSAVDVGRATITVATQANRGQWELVGRVHDGTTLLTLSQTRAIDVGLAQAIVRDVAQLKQHLGASSVITLPPSRVAVVAFWLTRPWVRALLVIALIIGAAVEMQAPGLGIGGIISLAALAILIGAPLLVGMAQLWHVLLFFVGVALIIAEIFFIPGFGLLGICGIVSVFAGLVLMGVPTTGQGFLPMPAPETARQLRELVLYTLLAMFASGVGLFYLARSLGRIPLFDRLILKDVSTASAGAGATLEARLAVGQPGQAVVRPGATGKSITVLRPTGQAQIDGQVLDVVSQGEWIEPNQPIRVVAIHGNEVLVDRDN